VTSGEIHFTATIAAHGSDTKTSYTEHGSNINVAWVVGDEIALIYNGVKDVATVTAVDANGKATIEATLTGSPTDEDDIRLVYPADAVVSTASGTGITPEQAFMDKMLTQDGTLDYIHNIDLRMVMGKIAVQGTDAGLKEDVKLSSAISIWKFTLQDDASTPNALNATELKIRIGGQLVAKAVDTAKGTFYLGVDAAINPSADVSVEATVGTDTYIYTKTGGVSITNSKYYRSTISMTKVDMLTVPLTLEAITNGTITVTNPKSGMQYSRNGGAKTPVTNDAIEVGVGDKVSFYGDGTNISYYEGTEINGGTAQVKAYGNIMSLVDETGFATATTLTQNVFFYSFYNLFSNYTNLIDASGLMLPATTLTDFCYNSMFRGCSSLTTAPTTLPATTLTHACYAYMFDGCSSLKVAPELPTETLAYGCYAYMFKGCSSLKVAPELPATILTESCYAYMFRGCSSLTTAPTLPAETLANRCYAYMFEGCSSLTTAPTLPAETLAFECYAYMFQGCSSLKAAPELPAEALVEGCYHSMFSGCSSLTTAPELPAETLTESCYNDMFRGCSSLKTAPVLPAETLVEGCYGFMFYGCTQLSSVTCLATNISALNCTSHWLSDVAASGTFTTPSSTAWTIDSVNGIPTGWTRVNYEPAP
jgi:hypothetical protein